MAGKHQDIWTPPEGYYEWVAEKQPNPMLHKAAIVATSTALLARHGRPRIIAPESVVELEGGSIIVPTHRSAIDTLVVPHTAERVGLNYARPIAKGSLFDNRLLASLMHNLGAFGVKRGAADMDGISLVQKRVLESGGHLINFAEGKRIHQDPLKVAKLHRSIGSIAAVTGRPIIPLGLAGLSESRDDNKDLIAKDKRAPFGIGPKIVAVFGNPIFAEKLSEDSDRRDVLRSVKSVMPRVATSLQECLDLAYLIRGSSLENQKLLDRNRIV